jgi:hypothetical protein
VIENLWFIGAWSRFLSADFWMICFPTCSCFEALREILEHKGSAHPFENVQSLLPPCSWLGLYPVPGKCNFEYSCNLVLMKLRNLAVLTWMNSFSLQFLE